MISFLRAVPVLVFSLPFNTGTGWRAQPGAFTFGASRDEVRRLQGAPDVVERLTQLDVEIWSWQTASVRFSLPGGRVTGWDDPQLILRADPQVRGARSTARDIAIGATGTDVVAILGRPRQVRRTDHHDHWGFRGAVVAIGIDDGRVAGWRDPDRRLPVQREQDADAREAFGIAPAGGRATGSPRLIVRASLRDTSAESRSVGSTNAVIVTIENAGPGTAFSIAPAVRVTRGRASLSEWRDAPASSLPAGTTMTRSVPFELLGAGPDSVVEFTARVAGAEHAGAARTILPFRVADSPRPQLVLEDVRIDDQSGDGRLSPREIASVQVSLRNGGTQHARGLVTHLSLGRDLYAVAGTPSRFPLPPMDPGATGRLRFSVYTLSRAESATVTLQVSDASGRYTQRILLPLRLERAGYADAPGRGPGTDSRIDDDPPVIGARNQQALAVLFGIDRYRTLPPARYAARDATTMRRHLVNLFGVPDDAEHLFVRADADATGAEFRKAFGPTGWLARRATPQSDIVIFYAGHGAATAGGNPMLLPWDADANYPAETGFSLEEVYQALSRIPARTITLVIDACFAGLTRTGAPLVEGSRPIVLSVEHPALLREGMTLFAAAQGAQAAGDLPAARHGLFSYWMMRGLRGEADGNGDRALSIGELQEFVARSVTRDASRRDREQRPLVITRDTARILLRGLPDR